MPAIIYFEEQKGVGKGLRNQWANHSKALAFSDILWSSLQISKNSLNILSTQLVFNT